MLTPLVKRLIKSFITVIRRVPALFAFLRKMLSLFPRLESLAIRIVGSSFAPALRHEDKLSDAEIRVLIDLREAISAKKGNQL